MAKQNARNNRLNALRKLAALAVFVCIVQVALPAQSARRTIHVFVALADNLNQGIVPVPARLGNGEDAEHNLYWGAAFGVKTFFKNSADWKLLAAVQKPKAAVLERCIFKHRTADVYLIADAYEGIQIQQAIVDFLGAAAGAPPEKIVVKNGPEVLELYGSGGANLAAYVGHEGLMDFKLNSYPEKRDRAQRDAIILACISKSYFAAPLRAAGANPLLWTTGLMAPEAYTLKAAIDGWILGESSEQVRERAANAYHEYQKCSLVAAKKLLVTGW